MCEYSGEIPCEIRPVHWTRCVYCQEQQEQSQKGRLPVCVYVLQVTHCAEHIPAITRSHHAAVLGWLGDGTSITSFPGLSRFSFLVLRGWHLR